MKSHITVGTNHYPRRHELESIKNTLRGLVSVQFVLLIVIIGCFALAAHIDSLGGL